MVIGLDVDNVISDFDKLVMEAIVKSGKKIVRTDTPLYKERFNWTSEEKNIYFQKNMEKLAKKLPVRKNARYVINKLKELGNEIVIISHRIAPDFGEPYETTYNWLKKNKIYFDTLVISKSIDKVEECKSLGVDVYLDDRVDAVKEMQKNGVNAVVMQTRYNVPLIKNVQFAKSWLDFYKNLKIGKYMLPLG